MHQLFEVADANLSSVSAAARKDEQLYERIILNVVVFGLPAEDFDHVVLFELNLFIHRVLQKVFQRQWFLTVFVHARLTHGLRKSKVRSQSATVVF